LYLTCEYIQKLTILQNEGFIMTLGDLEVKCVCHVWVYAGTR
jgi:hypothetical protein